MLKLRHDYRLRTRLDRRPEPRCPDRRPHGGRGREDFPGEQDEWLNYNIVTKKGEDGKMQLTKVERPEADAELQRIAKSTIEDLELEIAEENK